MKTKIYTIAILALAIAASCKKTQETPAATEPVTKVYTKLEKAESFLGRWENNSNEGNLSEIWTRKNDSVFHGESYFVIGKDTVFAESVRLFERENQLIYEVTVKGQNNEKPVEFVMISSDSKQLVFENPQHDFPNKVIYRVTADSLVAQISGTKDGKPATENFQMKKTNN